MNYSRIVFRTSTGRMISILRDDTVEPGDVDHYIYYGDIPRLRKALAHMNVEGRPIDASEAGSLIKWGILHNI